MGGPVGETIYERQVQTQERMLLNVREHEQIIEAIEAATAGVRRRWPGGTSPTR